MESTNFTWNNPSNFHYFFVYSRHIKPHFKMYLILPLLPILLIGLIVKVYQKIKEDKAFLEKLQSDRHRFVPYDYEDYD